MRIQLKVKTIRFNTGKKGKTTFDFLDKDGNVVLQYSEPTYLAPGDSLEVHFTDEVLVPLGLVERRGMDKW